MRADITLGSAGVDEEKNEGTREDGRSPNSIAQGLTSHTWRITYALMPRAPTERRRKDPGQAHENRRCFPAGMLLQLLLHGRLLQRASQIVCVHYIPNVSYSDFHARLLVSAHPYCAEPRACLLNPAMWPKLLRFSFVRCRKRLV